jgi:hypothetical protein
MQLRASKHPLAIVCDVTLAYEGQVPQKESQLFTGQMPRAVHCHIRSYAASELPQDARALEAWVAARFAAKERALCRFYSDAAAGVRTVLRVDAAEVSQAALAGQSVQTGIATLTPRVLRCLHSARTYQSCLAIGLSFCLLLSWAIRWPVAFLVYCLAYFCLYVLLLPRIGGFDAFEVQQKSEFARSGRAD